MNRSTLTIVIALAVGLAVAIAVPYVAPLYWVSLTSIVFIAAILAASVNMLAGLGGLVSLGHAGIAAGAAYGVAWATVQGWGVAGQLGLAAIVTLALSLIYGLVSMRTNGIYFIMVTLAVGMVIFGLAYRLAPITGGENGLSGIRRPEAVSEYWQFYFVTLVGFIVVTFALWIVAKSPFGTTLRGIRDSESRMLSLGYQISRYKLAAMMISGTVAGFAGVLSVWHTQFVSPSSAGFPRSALAVVMVILGGVGSVFGPLIGAAIVVWIEQVLSTDVARWPTVLGLVFIFVILFAPKGVTGIIPRVRGWIANRRHRRGHLDEVARPSTDGEATKAPESFTNPSGTTEKGKKL